MSTGITQTTTEVTKPNNRGANTVDNFTTPQATTEDSKLWQPVKPLTRKQQAFVKHLIDNPKASATQAARAAYNVTTDRSARQVATENMAKPSVQLELAKHSSRAELVVLEVLEQSRKMMYTDERNGVNWAVNARQTADSLLDRVHGKATQRTEVKQSVVTLNIDLTAATTGVEEK